MKRRYPYLLLYLLLVFTNAKAQELVLEDCLLSYKRQATRWIQEDHYGFIWLMRNDGYYRFDGKVVELIDLTVDFESPIFHAGAELLAEENGDYWFAARDAGLIVYRAKEDRFLHRTFFEVGDSSVQIYCRTVATRDVKGANKWVSGDNGIWEVDQELQILKHIEPAKLFGAKKWKRHNMNEIRKIVFDEKRNLFWIGGKAGLFSYDLSTQELQRHMVDERFCIPEQNFFLINDIRLENDQLICTTWFAGILVYNIEKKAWKQFVFADQVEVVRRNGNTQLTKTNAGTYFFAHETREVGSWRQGDTFFRSPTSDSQVLPRGIGAMVDRLGYLWMGYLGEVCRYRIVDEPPQARTAQIYIRSLSLDGVEQSKRMNRWDGHAFDILDPVAQIQFTFRAINPLSYDNISYEYKLTGQDETWQRSGALESVTYNDLSQGQYQFQARYWDELSQDYVYTGQLSLNIQPQDLFTKYIIGGLVGLLGLGVLVFLYDRKTQQRRQQKAAEKFEAQLLEVQDAALRAQMNPHFLFNSLNSIRYFIVTNDNVKAADYLTKFSRLIRMILEHSKKQLVLLEEELQLLQLYVKMEQIRFEDKFDFFVNIHADVSPKNIQIPPMLLQPYIENAILHGINPKDSNGTIRLNIKKENTLLVIEIADDGIGRFAARQLKKESILKKKSLGLSITKARLDLAHTSTQKASSEIIDRYDQHGQAIGTTVLLKIPLL